MTTKEILTRLIETLARLADKYERMGYEEKNDNNPLTGKFFLGEANGYAGAKMILEQKLDEIIDEEEGQALG